jgi:hypothetical protein
MNILDNPIYQCFVSPELCRKLREAGLTSETAYHYRISGNIAEINTYVFDRDDYYLEGDANINAVTPVEILPAYQLKDIEKAMPGHHCLLRNEKGYELMIDSVYCLPEQTAERMPDVYALMFLEGCRQRLFKVSNANSLITQ